MKEKGELVLSVPRTLTTKSSSQFHNSNEAVEPEILHPTSLKLSWRKFRLRIGVSFALEIEH